VYARGDPKHIVLDGVSPIPLRRGGFDAAFVRLLWPLVIAQVWWETRVGRQKTVRYWKVDYVALTVDVNVPLDTSLLLIASSAPQVRHLSSYSLSYYSRRRRSACFVGTESQVCNLLRFVSTDLQ